MPIDAESLLKSVSRSFYLSLRIVPSPLRPVVGAGYLVCRLADTVVDTEALPFRERLAALAEFDALLNGFPLSRENGDRFGRALAGNVALAEGPERALVENAGEVFSLLRRLTPSDEALVHQVARGVLRGMRMDLETFGDGSRLAALPRSSDLENYLSSIGGEPGRFWSAACRAHFPDLVRRDLTDWIEDGIAFGRGLQMINILRDLPGDLDKGRCYLPLDRLRTHDLDPEGLKNGDRPDAALHLFHELIDETLGRLERGLAYLERLPRNAVRLRAAVWWPMEIGLRTLVGLRGNREPWRARDPVKVRRSRVYAIVAGSAAQLPFDAWLRREFERLSERASSKL